MRKQTKIAAVVSAAALLALGASMTSFAASKGTWMMVDGEWYCYDKNGDAYTNVFCSSNGKEYFVGDDGQLVRSSWVEYDGDQYFVNSSGAKITNDWRLTTPYDDESADEEWYYFQSTGKMATNKKITYKGKTYYFDSEGQMLTGWVTYDSNANVDEANTFDKNTTFYCDETGARIEKDWVYSVEPGVEDDDADADEYWYYFKSSGKAQTGKGTNIKGQTYLFDNSGRMLTGWVAKSNSEYAEIGDENSTEKLSDYKGGDVYFCGDEDDGHAKKNKWFQTWKPSEYDEADEDNDQWWYYIDKNGKVYIPSDSNAAVGYKYSLGDATLEIKNNGNSYNITKKKVNSKDYFFNEDGEMLSKFIEVTTGNSDLSTGMYYFGGADDGSMKTGAQTVKDDNGDTYKFYFGTKNSTTETKGVGITGNKSNKLYYKGLLLTADDYKYQVAEVLGKKFIVNANGAIQHSNVEYKEDGDVLIDTRVVKDDNGNVVTPKATFETAEGLTKYSYLSGNFVNNVDEIDVTKVMH
ncbi:hypothetical protein LI187_11365 [bacterium 210820-DFI.6.38]|nr:hypothetical protein [bacterium 210820-DFI.6.38]